MTELHAEFTRAQTTTGTPGILNQLLQELEARIVLSSLSESGSSTAIVTIGNTLPPVQDQRQLRVHFLTASTGRLTGVATFTGGQWVVYSASVQIGAFAYFLETTQPAGWYKANGENGTIDMRGDAYDLGGLSQVFLYQYTGTF